MRLSEPFETERMRFRLLTTDDIAAVHRQFSDPDMCRYFSEPSVDLEEAKGIIEHYRDPEGKDHLRYGMFSRETGEFIGTCGYHYWDKELRQVEIGYDVWKAHWRQGYISEALPVLIDRCFDHLGLECVYVLVNPQNAASIASVRKLGFVECAPCRKPDVESEVCMKVSRTEWSARGDQMTPYPDVNALLSRLLTEIRSILGDRLVGMYLHGSLAGGVFDPDRSDIDYVVVTDAELPPSTVVALREMHARIAASDLKWATNHEGSYIPRHAIRRYDPTDCVHPAVRADGSFDLDCHGSEWVIQRHVIREHGVTLVGPDPKTLIDAITPDELRRAQRGLLGAWWAPQGDDPFRLRDSEYQAYAVLTMCRALYTLRHGTVVSKPAAAAWAKQTQGEQWGRLIDKALAWRHGVQLDELDRVLAFIRFALEGSGMCTLETDRLVLRRLNPDDWKDLYEYLSDETVVKYEPYGVFTEEACKQEALSRSQQDVFWAVCLRENNKLIGNVYFQRQEPAEFLTWEIGYVFNPAYGGKGYATEGCRKIIDYAFTRLSAHRIVAMCNSENVRSWKLLERLTMRREGCLRKNACFKCDDQGKPIWVDSFEYAILADEWSNLATD